MHIPCYLSSDEKERDGMARQTGQDIRWKMEGWGLSMILLCTLRDTLCITF